MSNNNTVSDRVDGHAIERFESLVLELNRAVFQFGLSLPPLVMWEEAFRCLNTNEIKYATDLLQVVYSHVHHPELLFSNYYIASEQWERIQNYHPANDASSTGKDPLGDLFNHDFSIMDHPIYVQSAFYYNRCDGLAELMRLYGDYLGNLQKSLAAIAWEKHQINIYEGFKPAKKILVGHGLDKLKLVADFLIEEGCIASSSKANFLALFGNVFMKDNVVQWIKENDSRTTNVAFLKELFVVLGVDMEDKRERNNVASCFCGINNEPLEIRSRGSRPNRSKELEDFSSRLEAILK